MSTAILRCGVCGARLQNGKCPVAACRSHDSDETEGRALYRDAAAALARAQMNLAQRRVRIVSGCRVYAPTSSTREEEEEALRDREIGRRENFQGWGDE